MKNERKNCPLNFSLNRSIKKFEFKEIIQNTETCAMKFIKWIEEMFPPRHKPKAEQKSDKEQESRRKEQAEQLRTSALSPMPPNQFFSLLFTRIKKEETRQIQYYFYSPDESLFYLIAALVKDPTLYIISTNSNENRTKQWEIGTLKCNRNGIYTGIMYNPTSDAQPFFFNSVRIRCNEDQSSIIVRIAPLNCPRFLFLDESNENDLSLRFEQIRPPPPQTKLADNIINLFHFGLQYQGSLCFTFNQRQEDEFFVQFAHPFSLFQAFCISIAVASSFCA